MRDRQGMRRGRSGRRGAALAGAVLVMTVVNLAVISAVVAGTGDGLVVSWRVHGLRATLAAESAAFIARGELGAGRETDPGPIELPGGEEVHIGAVEDGQVTVEGVVQDARRTLVVFVEVAGGGDDLEPEGGPVVDPPPDPVDVDWRVRLRRLLMELLRWLGVL